MCLWLDTMSRDILYSRIDSVWYHPLPTCKIRAVVEGIPLPGLAPEENGPLTVKRKERQSLVVAAAKPTNLGIKIVYPRNQPVRDLILLELSFPTRDSE